MTEFPQSLRLNLANALSSYIKILFDFFKGMIGFLIDAEAHL